jgi:coproporphyrinogen III oxidase
MSTFAEMDPTARQARVADTMRRAQDVLCAAFAQQENAEAPGAQFVAAPWERPGTGGGEARVLSEGRIFERAGINSSVVHGDAVPPAIWQERPTTRDQPFFATGISMVLHPRNPYVPAFHTNFRYFEVADDWWFGGGMDLTPCYGFAEDAAHFHRTLRAYCQQYPLADYPAWKAACDDYFYLAHRQEMRGIGGIFFDKLHPPGAEGWQATLDFVQHGVNMILDAYLPLVQRRMGQPYGERERQWQLYRRGRYVEFNLVYDRGTLFGLQTSSNVEAILMSLPPLARWEFDYQPPPGSPEAALAAFLQPHDWAAEQPHT